MKLLHNCVRDTMIYLEKNLGLNDCIISCNIDLPKYEQDDITYTILKLSEAGFIRAGKRDLSGIIPITEITYLGHQFLDSIRDDNIWKKTTSKISKLASVSIPIIQQVATQLITLELGL